MTPLERRDEDPRIKTWRKNEKLRAPRVAVIENRNFESFAMWGTPST